GLRDAEGDAGEVSVLDVLGRRRRGWCGRGRRGDVHEEVEVATIEAYVDAAVRHLRGDLGGGLRDRLHDRQPSAGVEGEAEPLGGLAGLLTGGVRGGD